MKKFFISLGLLAVAVVLPMYLTKVFDGRGRAASEEVYLTPPFTPPSSPTETPVIFTPPSTGANVRVNLSGLDPQINSAIRHTLVYSFEATEPITGEIQIRKQGLGPFNNGILVNVVPNFVDLRSCTNNNSLLITCPINNKRLGQISAELRFGTGPGLDLTGTWSTNVGVFARSASGIGVSDFKVYSTEVFYSPTGPTPTPRPTVTPTSVPLQGFVPTVLGGIGSTAVCSKSDRFCSLQFTASFRNPNSQYIYKPVFWKSGLGRFIDGYGIWRSDSNIYPASQQDTVDPVYGTVSTVVNIDNPGVVGSYGGTIYAAGKFCYNMADPATCTKVVPSASIAYKLIVVPDVTPTPVAAYCGLGGIYSYVNCNVKDGGYISAKYDCYNGPTKLYTGSLSYSQCTSLSDIKKQASLMCAKRCSILKETVGTLKKGL